MPGAPVPTQPTSFLGIPARRLMRNHEKSPVTGTRQNLHVVSQERFYAALDAEALSAPAQRRCSGKEPVEWKIRTGSTVAQRHRDNSVFAAILSVPCGLSKPSNCAILLELPIKAGNRDCSRVSFMRSIIAFAIRFIGGFIGLCAVWFVLDKIKDRNTEIIVSMIGILYVFIFQLSGRQQYFGLTVFSFLGRTTSYVRKVPYDQILRDEVGLDSTGRHLYLNGVFAALVELLCLVRLFSSLLGSGWNLLSDPIHRLIQVAHT